MKRILILMLLLGTAHAVYADHITGGEMYYSYVNMQNGSHLYRITIKVYMRCNSGRQFNNPTIVSIFDKGTNNRIVDNELVLARTENIQLANANKCITDPPLVCYEVGYYEFTAVLPPSANGYVVAAQFVFRIAGIRNLVSGYSNVGTTYTAEIPADANGAAKNNSARFVGSDLVVICADNNFAYSFAAQDADGDELRYSFCEAYQGGVFRLNEPLPPSPPNYSSVPYGNGYSGGAPLGSQVKIDPKTGLITGKAPAEGIYVITVCVSEIRNGTVIAVQRKDLQVFIASCTIAAANLQSAYNLCRESTTLSVTNQSTSPLITSYNWEVLNSAGNVLADATTASLNYTFADTGTYRLRLTINRGGDCTDSNEAIVRVYPGFKPAFTYQGLCIEKPTQFTDASTSVYGQVTGWQWNFGDFLGSEGSGSTRSPSYQYGTQGVRNVVLTVSNSVGCTDTAVRALTIIDKPPLRLQFKDTTICRNDVLQLVALGSGNYQWGPQGNITNAQTSTPSVSPQSTTTYIAQLNDNGCTNRDSVLVKVVDKVSMQPLNDTVICTGDVARILLTSDALQYNWQPAATVLEPGARSPLVQPLGSTTYQVTGTIGGCSAVQTVNIKTVPYPTSNAGLDTAICFGATAFLRGSMVGSSFNWSPAASLQNTNTLQPLAKPNITTAYVLSVFDNLGCPKPGLDTVVVRVIAPVQASAGRDTAIVFGQPLQLEASGGDLYSWSPGTALSATNIANPVAVFNSNYAGDIIRYTVQALTPEGCKDTASIAVRIFATAPSVFVPNAFSPNGDGLNDWLRPIAAGMQRIEQFMVFNRWGEVVYRGFNENGWDGNISGNRQSTGVYVWMVKAIDFQGKSYTQKGTVMLMR